MKTNANRPLGFWDESTGSWEFAPTTSYREIVAFSSDGKYIGYLQALRRNGQPGDLTADERAAYNQVAWFY